MGARKIIQTTFILIVIRINSKAEELNKGWALVGNPLLHAYACNGTEKVLLQFEPGLPPGEENKYGVHISENVPKHTRVYIDFDSEAKVTLSEYTKKAARISTLYNNIFTLNFFNQSNGIGFQVRGPATGTMPYIKSLSINSVEYCEHPQLGVLDGYIQGYKDTAETHLSVPNDTCGRRKVVHTELITNNQPTKPGDWPWHAALYKLDKNTIKYICGGTLISQFFVLTAAHCASVRGAPLLTEILSVVLGKYNLIGGDTSIQEKEVHRIILHDNFNYTNLNNDIALLNLKTETQYNDFVQPACLWFTDAYKKLGSQQLIGTVVGWGFDNTDSLSPILTQATMPHVSENVCIKSNPLFFSRMLTREKFCAGYANGTSACNGDSGGGFVVFVPDVTGDLSANATGAWHVRGIVSVAVSRRDMPICDPYQYVLFTDIAKYKGWINQNIK